MSALRKLDEVSGFEPRARGYSVSCEQLFERDVYGLLGVPVDIVDLNQVIDRLDAAIARRTPFFLSTPNLNFLVQSRNDASFRETLLTSDLCPADGMPIIWLSKILGIPAKQRIPGSDIFETLKRRSGFSPIRVFFFGGAAGVAEVVAYRINAECAGLKCVGTIYPGFGTVEQMSSQSALDQINSSRADFIAIFLSAKKGQEWIMKNAAALSVPVRAQLGATINFQAGTVSRAPPFLRAIGLEWAWRIIQEPFLGPRYLRDGLSLIWIAATVILPLLALKRLSWDQPNQGAKINSSEEGAHSKLQIIGPATLPNIALLQEAFSTALQKKEGDLVVDLARVTDVDPRFFGLLVVARKILKESGRNLCLINTGATIRRLFRLHGFAYLLTYRP